MERYGKISSNKAALIDTAKLPQWPSNLIPIKARVFGAAIKPTYPGRGDIQEALTEVHFERVLIDRADFESKILNHLNVNSSKENDEMLTIMCLIPILGEDFCSQQVGLERQFHKKSVLKPRDASLNPDTSIFKFASVPLAYKKLLPKELWALALKEILDTFYDGVTKSYPEINKQKLLLAKVKNGFDKYEQDNMNFMKKNKRIDNIAVQAFNEKQFTAARKWCSREVMCDENRETLRALLAQGYKYIGELLTESCNFLCELITQSDFSKSFTDPIATSRFIKFWYTNSGGLNNTIPIAFNDQTASVFAAIDEKQQEDFDRAMFINGEPPPREVCESLYKMTKTHQNTLPFIREADRNRKTQKSVQKKKAPKKQATPKFIVRKRSV